MTLDGSRYFFSATMNDTRWLLSEVTCSVPSEVQIECRVGERAYTCGGSTTTSKKAIELEPYSVVTSRENTYSPPDCIHVKSLANTVLSSLSTSDRAPEPFCVYPLALVYECVGGAELICESVV